MCSNALLLLKLLIRVNRWLYRFEGMGSISTVMYSVYSRTWIEKGAYMTSCDTLGVPP